MFSKCLKNLRRYTTNYCFNLNRRGGIPEIPFS